MYSRLLLITILILGSSCQELLMTSDASVEVQDFANINFGSGSRGTRQVRTADPPRTLQIQTAVPIVSGGQGTIVSGGSFGGSFGGDGFQIFPPFRPRPPTRPPTQPTSPRPPTSSKAQFASFAQPSAQASRSKSAAQRSFKQSRSYDSAVEKNVASAKWIYPGPWNWYRVGFYTPCFHNPCPRGQYTVYISATCDFDIYLVDQYGNYVSTIGSGYAWWSYKFSFYAPCGKYRILFVLKCSCACPYIRYNVYQNRKDCFNCPDNLIHTYNPNTCQCECASNCQDCKQPQTWYNYPRCTCACSQSQICKPTQYFNRKTCRCQCLPQCCQWFYPQCNINNC